KLLSVLLAVGLVTAGALAVAYQGGARPAEEAQKAKEKSPDQPAEKSRPRLDRHGDPLPEGALARLGTLRWRALGEVEAPAFAPDSKGVATVSRQGLCFFDREGKLLKTLRPDRAQYERLAFSPDGKQVACRAVVPAGGGRAKLVVQLWEWPGGKKVKE